MSKINNLSRILTCGWMCNGALLCL